MKKKKKIIIVSVAMFCALLIAGTLCGLLLFAPELTLTLNGGDEEIEVFSRYDDEGAQGKYGGGLISYRDVDVSESGNVDTNKIGEYTLEYITEYKDKKLTAHRTVKVVDKTKPTIDCAEEKITVYRGKKYIASYTAKDNYDGDITDKVKEEWGENSLILSVSDSSGNNASVSVPVEYLDDTTPPEFYFLGDMNMYMKVGSVFDEPGYSATDNADGDITDKVTVDGSVDTSEAGVYTITYTVTDEAGNTSQETRRVTVVAPAPQHIAEQPSGKVVYLTFDDGPCCYTADVLDVLAKYGAKATFFVTAQFPSYIDMIAREYSEGHAVGVHTGTHEFSIYSSVDSYLADFNYMQEVIKQQTGSYTDIMRFPGGSSNMVSRQFCAGIMTKLVSLVQEMGYSYFDWNVGSSDTQTTDPDVIYYNVTNGISKQSASVVLMHDIKPATLAALPRILEYCVDNGYTFGTLNASSPAVHHGVNN